MCLLALSLAVALPGCTEIGYLAGVVGGTGTPVTVKAQYEGLGGKRVAVMVAADEYTLYQFRDAPDILARAIASEIASHVPDTQFLNPEVIEKFKKENPYWLTMPYGELLRKFNVDRLVLVELGEYRLHEPGNQALWQGVASAQVEVYSNQQADPDEAVFRSDVRSAYPPDRPMGVTDSDEQTMKLGIMVTFARDVAWLFYDHQETQK